MTQRDAYQLIHDGILAFGRAELAGMRVDLEYMRREKKRLTYRIEKLKKVILATKLGKDWKKKYGQSFNINSGLQLRNLLYKDYKLKTKHLTKTGMGKTDDESLSELNIEGIPELLKMRKLLKIRDTYLEAFLREQVDGYIHPFFNLHNVVTFRSSASNPNFQNIPKRDKQAMQIVRNAIFARPGHQLMEVDFSKLEVSIAACYHKDPVMLKYLTSEHNDMHGDVAAQIFKIKNFDKHIPEYAYLRSATKNGFVFPQFYGDYYVGNAEGLTKWVKLPHSRFKPGQGVAMPGGINISDHLIKHGIPSYNAFVEHLKDIEFDFWHNRFNVYRRWKEKWVAAYQKKGYFYSLTGFKYSGIYRKNQVINYPVQGAASHCLLWSFIQVDKWLQENNMDTRLIGQIHDAMVLDVNPKELEIVYEKVREVTTVLLPKAWKWIIVPLDVETEITPVDGPWSKKYVYEGK